MQLKENIVLHSVLNFRDIGGIRSEKGNLIRQGIIFRSANTDWISKRDIAKLHRLNIRTIIDLRAAYEIRKNKRAIDNIDYISLPLDFEQTTRERLKPFLYKKSSERIISEISKSLYLEILDAALPAVNKILEIILETEQCPVLIHCQAGKDRTGIICALILLALGIDRQSIIEDYLKSNEALLPFFKRKLLIRKVLTFGFFPSGTILFAITVRRQNIESVLERIENHYGGIEAYIKVSGFDTSRLPELKSILLAL